MSEQEPSGSRDPVDVDTVLAIMIEQLASIGWQKLGLQPDMATGTIVKDLDQAKRAIDAVGELAGVLEPQLDDSDRRHIQNIVRDLRMNFIEKSKEATA